MSIRKRHFLVILAVLALTVLTVPAASAAPPACTAVVVRTARLNDTYVWTTGLGDPTASILQAGRRGADDYRALMPFTPPALPGMSRVCKAKLLVHVADVSGVPQDVVTGQILPGGLVAPTGSAWVGTLGLGWNAIDVTDIVDQWVHGVPNHGIGLREAVPGPNFMYYISSANSPYVPRIVIEYAP